MSITYCERCDLDMVHDGPYRMRCPGCGHTWHAGMSTRLRALAYAAGDLGRITRRSIEVGIVPPEVAGKHATDAARVARLYLELKGKVEGDA